MAKYEMDMTSGNIGLKLLKFSIPLILSSILQLLYNAFDIIVLGHFSSSTAMAAVSSTTSLVNLFVNFFLGLTLGSTVLMSRFFASKDFVNTKKTVQTTIITSVIVGFLVSILGATLSKYMLILMKADPTLIDLSTIYLQIYFSGIIFNIVYNFGASLLRAVGDTRRPLLYLTIAGVLNICFNLLFVCVFHLDVAGVALGTMISEAVSAVLVIMTLIRSPEYMRFSFKDWRIDKKIFKNIFLIGLPASLQSVIFNISNVMIQTNINTFKEAAITGNGVASSLEGFVYAGMNSVYQGTISFVSQNVGAHKVKNVPRIMFFSHLYVVLANVIFGSIILLFPRFFISIYLQNPTDQVIDYAYERMLLMIITYFLCGFMDVCSGGLRGLGHSSISTIITVVGIVGFRITWIYTFFQMNHTLLTLYISYPISWVATWLISLIVLILIYRKTLKAEQASLQIEG